MTNFQLEAPFEPTGDQPKAIDKLLKGVLKGLDNQVLLGVTGSGKTFTIANIIKEIKRPTLIISHNKTLAAQLYQEFRDFFPKNAVSYFVSYYDYYQPEAYIPRTDTYIEKETEINEEIDKLRLSATANLLTRKDTIIVASVSCIYNLGSPKEYGRSVLQFNKNTKIDRHAILARLVSLQYTKNNLSFKRGNFRVIGENFDIFPAYEDVSVRIETEGDYIRKIMRFDPLNGITLKELEEVIIYPAKHYLTDPDNKEGVFKKIRIDLKNRVNKLKREGKILEAYRLAKKVNYDLEMIDEVGYINGIENYSRYFDGRKPGDPPFTLLDYFREQTGNATDWLLFIDESHMTVPQIRGMYRGDRSRKQTLVDFGFRLPSALDNRPLTFSEFMERTPQKIYVSATPCDWEISMAIKDVLKSRFTAHKGIAEQLIRPTGILDPEIFIRPIKGQISDLVKEIIKRKAKGERVLVTTLTKRMAEELTHYFNQSCHFRIEQVKVQYLHSDTETLERSDILDDLRSGKYDVLVGINLLREGLDLPEVSLVAILDADKEGFLRSKTSLIQTMGRAARHHDASVIMYADEVTNSMKEAIEEIGRRRNIQLEYNRTHHLVPKKIDKPIRSKLIERETDEKQDVNDFLDMRKRMEYRKLLEVNTNQLTPQDKSIYIKKMEKEMKEAARDLNFELASEIRDKIIEIKNNF